MRAYHILVMANLDSNPVDFQIFNLALSEFVVTYSDHSITDEVSEIPTRFAAHDLLLLL